MEGRHLGCFSSAVSEGQTNAGNRDESSVPYFSIPFLAWSSKLDSGSLLPHHFWCTLQSKLAATVDFADALLSQSTRGDDGHAVQSFTTAVGQGNPVKQCLDKRKH